MKIKLKRFLTYFFYLFISNFRLKYKDTFVSEFLNDGPNSKLEDKSNMHKNAR